MSTTIETRKPDLTPTTAPLARGTFVIVPGRGDTAHAYDRLSTRLRVDSYRVEVLLAPTDPDSLRASIESLSDLPSPVVVIAADVSAAILSIALGKSPVHGLSGVVIAGAATTPTGSAAANIGDEIALRTACPVHTRVLSESLNELSFTEGSDRWSRIWIEGQPIVTVPSLVIHGAADLIGSAAVVDAATTEWPARTLAVVGGGAHDVLNDVHHRTVAASIVQFAESLRLDASGVPILTITRSSGT